MLDDIKKTLWAAADKLRANMDAAEYKHIVLGMIFLKYISDTFKARRDELATRFADEADNAAAVTEHAHDAAMLPVGFLFIIGKLKHSQQVFGAVHRDLIFNRIGVGRTVRGLLFDIGHKTRPGAGFKLVQLRRCEF